jgi:uncharacterized MAPEG superfamily protein
MAGRLKRAQYNLFETLPLFIGAVLIARVAGRENTVNAIGAQVYFRDRVASVPLYAFGIRHVRSLVRLVSAAGLVAILYAILAPH